MPAFQRRRLPVDANGNLIANIVPRVGALADLQDLRDGNGELMSAEEGAIVQQSTGSNGLPRTFKYLPVDGGGEPVAMAFGLVRLLDYSALPITIPAADGTNYTIKDITIPGGVMGPNGSIRVKGTGTLAAGSSGSRRLNVIFGGTTYLSPFLSGTSVAPFSFEVTISNRNDVASQVGSIGLTSGASAAYGIGGSSAAVPTSAVNTDNDVTLRFEGNSAAGAGLVTLERYSVELITDQPQSVVIPLPQSVVMPEELPPEGYVAITGTSGSPGIYIRTFDPSSALVPNYAMLTLPAGVAAGQLYRIVTVGVLTLDLAYPEFTFTTVDLANFNVGNAFTPHETLCLWDGAEWALVSNTALYYDAANFTPFYTGTNRTLSLDPTGIHRQVRLYAFDDGVAPCEPLVIGLSPFLLPDSITHETYLVDVRLVALSNDNPAGDGSKSASWHYELLVAGNALLGQSLVGTPIKPVGYAPDNPTITIESSSGALELECLGPPATVNAFRIDGAAALTPGSGYGVGATIDQSGGGGGSGLVLDWEFVDGELAWVSVTNPGTGYMSPPTLTVSGGGGSGATAEIAGTYISNHWHVFVDVKRVDAATAP